MSKLLPRERNDEDPKTESVEIRVTVAEKKLWKRASNGNLSEYIRTVMNKSAKAKRK